MTQKTHLTVAPPIKEGVPRRVHEYAPTTINVIVIVVAFWALFTHMTTEFKSIRDEIRNETTLIRQEMAAQAQRTDRLYEMFYEVVKERNSR